MFLVNLGPGIECGGVLADMTLSRRGLRVVPVRTLLGMDVIPSKRHLLILEAPSSQYAVRTCNLALNFYSHYELSSSFLLTLDINFTAVISPFCLISGQHSLIYKTALNGSTAEDVALTSARSMAGPALTATYIYTHHAYDSYPAWDISSSIFGGSIPSYGKPDTD
ncbi:hypothetical protein AAF712_003821 [Marasmius tenuissimus]|uniref:Uncharacterized protein n=1 Tax=Marasmius tenuissimus TaxID=585030 RepID=A0ABR3A596_9AGAR